MPQGDASSPCWSPFLRCVFPKYLLSQITAALFFPRVLLGVLAPAPPARQPPGNGRAPRRGAAAFAPRTRPTVAGAERAGQQAVQITRRPPAAARGAGAWAPGARGVGPAAPWPRVARGRLRTDPRRPLCSRGLPCPLPTGFNVRILRGRVHSQAVPGVTQLMGLVLGKVTFQGGRQAPRGRRWQKARVGVRAWRRPEAPSLLHNLAWGCPRDWAPQPRMSPEFQVLSDAALLPCAPQPSIKSIYSLGRKGVGTVSNSRAPGGGREGQTFLWCLLFIFVL